MLQNKKGNLPELQVALCVCYVPLCSERESNPYGHFCPQDFKSGVSTYSTIRACLKTCAKILSNFESANIIESFAIISPLAAPTFGTILAPEATFTE